MTNRYDRRSFLRRTAAAGLVVPTLRMLGCTPDDEGHAEGTEGAADRSITRPVLLPWTAGAVRIAAPVADLPMAYVSRGAQRVFVDGEHRDGVAVILAAHISVSSGLWRIPLLGDDLRVPIPADDALREFEETDIGEWNPESDPVEGDFRVRWGRRATVKVHFDCSPLSGEEGWLSVGPLEIVQCGMPGDGPCLEALQTVGTGTRYERRYCDAPGRDVRLVTWACPDP